MARRLFPHDKWVSSRWCLFDIVVYLFFFFLMLWKYNIQSNSTMLCGLFSTYMTALLSGFDEWCTSAGLLSPFGAKEDNLGKRTRKKMSTKKSIKKHTFGIDICLPVKICCVFKIMCLKICKRSLNSTPSPQPLLNLFYVFLFHQVSWLLK